jgi:hypothetical protein
MVAMTEAALYSVLYAGIKTALNVWADSMSGRAGRGLMDCYVEKGAIYTLAKFEEADLRKRPQLFRANYWIPGVRRGHEFRNMVMPATELEASRFYLE